MSVGNTLQLTWFLVAIAVLYLAILLLTTVRLLLVRGQYCLQQYDESCCVQRMHDEGVLPLSLSLSLSVCLCVSVACRSHEVCLLSDRSGYAGRFLYPDRRRKRGWMAHLWRTSWRFWVQLVQEESHTRLVARTRTPARSRPFTTDTHTRTHAHTHKRTHTHTCYL